MSTLSRMVENFDPYGDEWRYQLGEILKEIDRRLGPEFKSGWSLGAMGEHREFDTLAEKLAYERELAIAWDAVENDALWGYVSSWETRMEVMQALQQFAPR